MFPSPRGERVSPGHLVAVATRADGAQTRASYEPQDPGPRAYASAGLSGAEWWVAGGVPENADVELDDVDALCTENDPRSAVFDSDR